MLYFGPFSELYNAQKIECRPMDSSESNNNTQRGPAVTFTRYECDFCLLGHHKCKVYICMPHVLEASEIGIMYTNVENMMTPLSKVSLMCGK
jgi:hypothetical protein